MSKDKKKTDNDNNDRYKGDAGNFTTLDNGDDTPGPQKSIEGWILFVTGIHEESQEDDLYDAFSQYGPIKNLHLNLDRRSGFVKGYALIEYVEFKDASEALKGMDGAAVYGKAVSVDWAFRKPTKKQIKPTNKK